MKRHNKENYPTTLYRDPQFFNPKYNIEKKKNEYCKSTQELLALKHNIYGNINNNGNGDKNWEHRFTSVMGNNTKYNTHKNGNIWDAFQKKNEKEQKEVLKQIKSHENNINVMSTIEMLKKQVQMLDRQQNLGTLQRLSSVQYQQIFQQALPYKSIILQVNRQRKNNIRKIAKGRPELYNWVRNYKKEIAEIQSEYKTQILRKYSAPKSQFCDLKQVKEAIMVEKDRTIESSGKSRRLSFAQRLKRLEEIKERGQSYHFKNKKRTYSQQQEEQPCEGNNLKTLS